ncbi:MAG: AGE family epimerase/isomerase [Bacteroidota bacterium]|nr:AGE family epimerase/isomerase [Bacteroidota bacterium]
MEVKKETNIKIYHQEVNQSIEKFIHWLRKNGYYSYDQYDFWGTAYGIKAKEIYYKNKVAGIPLVSPVFVSEIFFPSVRKVFVSKKRFPIADAHFIMAFLNLYEVTSNQEYLEEAKKIAVELLKSSVSGFSGNSWGYPFDWMTTRGLWTSGIPLITTTGYCFEAFLQLYNITYDKKYLDTAYSIFLFTLNDLTDTQIDKDTAACSYSPIDNSQIVNANAYRASVLIEGFIRFNNEEAYKKATLNINFILKSQNADGSWKYAVNDERDNFVDNFHTCFVLKNLIKINKFKKDERISEAIKKGYDFYKSNLIDSTGRPLPFAKLSRLNIVKRELYDYAEGISLGLLLKEQDAEAGDIVNKMVKDLVEKYQNKNGSYITRVNNFNIKNKIPYLRWPQAQLFFALTNYLKS